MADTGVPNAGKRPPPEPETVLRGHMADVQALAISDDNAHLLSGDGDGYLRVWDLDTARTVSSTRVSSAGVGITSITLSADGGTLLSQSRDGAVQVFRRLPSGDLERDGEISTGSYNFCRISTLWSAGATTGDSPGDTAAAAGPGTPALCAPLVATAGNDPAVIEIWSVRDRIKAMELSQPGRSMGMCMSLQLFCPTGHPDRPHVLAGYEDGTLSLWDCSKEAAPLCTLPHLHSEPIMGLALDSSASGAVSCSAGQKVAMTAITRAAGEESALVVSYSLDLPHPGASSVAVRPDGRIFAVGAWDSRVWIYKYPNCKPLASLQYHSAGVADVLFANGTDSLGLLASASQDNTIALWSIYPPSKRRPASRHSAAHDV